MVIDTDGGTRDVVVIQNTRFIGNAKKLLEK